jgi:hypothetical protein
MSDHRDSEIACREFRLEISDRFLIRGQSRTVVAIKVCASITGSIPVSGYRHHVR